MIGVISYDYETYETLNNEYIIFDEIKTDVPFDSSLNSLKTDDFIVAESYYPNEYTGKLGRIHDIKDGNVALKLITMKELVTVNIKQGLSKFKKFLNIIKVGDSENTIDFS